MIILLSRSGTKKVQQRAPYLTKADFLEALPAAGTPLELHDGTQVIAHGYTGHGHRYDACITDKPLGQQLFDQTLSRAYQFRLAKFSLLPEAYRLIHNEGDLLPGITIEIFQQYAVITYFNQGIMTQESQLIAALKNLLSLKGIYAKYRTPETTTKHTTLIWGKPAPEELIIQEATGNYSVRLLDGLMTGLFLDQRANRLWLQKNSKHKQVCNTFSYTGSLSVACGLGGATSTKSIDLSKTYTEWCKHNLELNKLDKNTHEAIISDTFSHFAYCKRKNISYDLIILDPPTFSKSKKGTFSVPDNYRRLTREAYDLLNLKGILMACTNYSQWSLAAFKQIIQNSLPPSAKIIKECGADIDFPTNPNWPESEHLKCVFLEKN